MYWRQHRTFWSGWKWGKSDRSHICPSGPTVRWIWQTLEFKIRGHSIFLQNSYRKLLIRGYWNSWISPSAKTTKIGTPRKWSHPQYLKLRLVCCLRLAEWLIRITLPSICKCVCLSICLIVTLSDGHTVVVVTFYYQLMQVICVFLEHYSFEFDLYILQKLGNKCTFILWFTYTPFRCIISIWCIDL